MNRAKASERLRQAAIAIALAVVIGASTLLRPLDITVWSLQAKLFDRQPSEEIALVQMDYGGVARERIAQNRNLTSIIKTLAASEAELIALDMPVQRSASASVDAALRQVLQSNQDRVILTRTFSEKSDRFSETNTSDPYFERGMVLASNDYRRDFLGNVWGIESHIRSEGDEYKALWYMLVDQPAQETYDVSLDYAVDAKGFTHLNFTGEQSPALEDLRSLAGKRVIVGPNQFAKIPGDGSAAASLIPMIAAETFSQGRGLSIPAFAMLAVFSVILLTGLALARGKPERRRFYWFWAAAIPITIVSFAYLGVRTGFSEILALALAYAIVRIVGRYKRYHLLFEPRSKLPNFVALRRDLDEVVSSENNPVVVAKIARLASVFTTLTVAEQGRYLRQIANRLALNEKLTTIYYDGGGYFAFVVDRAHLGDIEDHLLGLRAIASQAVEIDGRMLDVSMTIGLDGSNELGVPTDRVNAAIAAADQAREAYRPVFVITDTQTESEHWDYSLQARLEEALEQDRIAIALQPQADLATGRIVGAESLARWIDQKRGDVPPSQFITQCERVGRLDDLTRRVVAKTLNATSQIQAAGFDAQIAVNVSAIQFVDARIVDIFERELARHVLDPTKLTIEVTETARIEDYRTARDIIDRLKRMGMKFAIDDFGVGTANFEALFELQFDEIKIDRLFISRLTKSQTARSIVSSLTKLAREGDFVSVAEGIENRETFTLLRDLGCERGQGYYIGKPQQSNRIMQILEMQEEQWKIRRRLG